ncbi:MAG TPA: 16S rRNA processing protein RimM [Desulfobacteraceae bacterium]|nr:16S rRNA processing protein RimM [Desulfobacteraceae bacterium]
MAPSNTPTTTDTWLTIGKVTGVHGLAGNLKVWSFADTPETYGKGRKVRLLKEGSKAAPGKECVIEKASPRKKGLLLTLKGVSTREAAEALVGWEILMHKDQLPELGDDTWYWEDLIGLSVTDRNLGELGTIDHLFDTAAHDILVVKSAPETPGAKAPEIMIPLDDHFVEDVDMETGTVTTALPEGFILE